MRGYQKVGAAVVAVGLAGGLAACSSSGGSSAKKPVGQFKTLSGNATSVALDPGFVKALGTLKLTPGLIGSAKMSGTHGDVPDHRRQRDDLQEGRRHALRAGQDHDHDGSGLSLTGGATKVDLKNFVVDPGNNSKLTGEVDVDGKVSSPRASSCSIWTAARSRHRPSARPASPR